MNKQIVIQEGQTLWDIALQEMGSAEGVYLILNENPLLTINSEIAPGQKILIPKITPINNKVLDFFNSLNYNPASGSFIFTPTIIDPPTSNDGTVTNTDNTWSATVGTGGSLIIPDSNITLDLGVNGTELLKLLPATTGLVISVVDENGNKLSEISPEGNNIVVEEIYIRNSNNSFSQLISYVNNNILQDTIHKDTDGTLVSTPAMLPFECSPIPDSVFNPTKTGSTSFVTGDDGSTQAGRLNSFYILDFTNPYGNTTRFTNDLGGSVFDGSDGSTADYVVDNATKLGWKLSWVTATNITTHLANASTLTIGTYSGFRVANFNEFVTIKDASGVNWWSQPDQSIWNAAPSGTGYINTPINATSSMRFYRNAGFLSIGITTSLSAMFVRNHTY